LTASRESSNHEIMQDFKFQKKTKYNTYAAYNLSIYAILKSNLTLANCNENPNPKPDPNLKCAHLQIAQGKFITDRLTNYVQQIF